MEDCTLVVVLKAYLQLHKFYIMSLCILNLCCKRMILWVAFGGGKDYIILWVQTLRNGSLKAKRWIMVLLVWMRTVTMFLTSWYPDLYKVPSCTESRLVFLVNVCVCVCVCVHSHVWLFAIPGTVANQAYIFQARILEWVVISYSRGSSWPRDWLSPRPLGLLCCQGGLYN